MSLNDYPLQSCATYLCFYLSSSDGSTVCKVRTTAAYALHGVSERGTASVWLFWMHCLQNFKVRNTWMFLFSCCISLSTYDSACALTAAFTGVGVCTFIYVFAPASASVSASSSVSGCARGSVYGSVFAWGRGFVCDSVIACEMILPLTRLYTLAHIRS